MSTASNQITEYLSVGGLFNPEIMNRTQHEAVRDTLIKARTDIQQLERENVALRADKERLDWLDKNMTARDSFQTFEKEVLIGELRQAIDAAMRKEDKP